MGGQSFGDDVAGGRPSHDAIEEQVEQKNPTVLKTKLNEGEVPVFSQLFSFIQCPPLNWITLG